MLLSSHQCPGTWTCHNAQLSQSRSMQWVRVPPAEGRRTVLPQRRAEACESRLPTQQTAYHYSADRLAFPVPSRLQRMLIGA